MLPPAGGVGRVDHLPAATGGGVPQPQVVVHVQRRHAAAIGLALEEIAAQLSLGHKTVANYQTVLKHKLGFNSSVELVRLAIKYKVINND